ncbi:MAG TPA: glycosyl hydrolase 115 family protein [Steroidobacteraceae bacterium]|nr:glycosyl hydrolase 115 family protein [Steroidobacteraceae bacterium]
MRAWLLAGLLFCSPGVLALGQQRYVQFDVSGGGFALVNAGAAADLIVDSNDFAAVMLAAKNLQSDIARVSGLAPRLLQDPHGGRHAVLIGTIGHSEAIDRLIAQHKLDVAAIAGKWESFLVQVVAQPLPGIDSALVICGSDRRGTVFGIYDLSEQIGVSPWYDWADVPSRHRDRIFIKAGRYVQGEPAVKYRGIFLNDEYPDLTRWVREKYGNAPGYASAANYGHEFYARLFELILRLKGNYLWPAMWDNAFNEDDPDNPRLADEYGVVMGTSHQEPMLRAQQEWDRRYLQDHGHWNYAKEPELLQQFWREGIRRNRNYESLITIGLRGANDTPMAPGGPEANRKLLERIVDVQRGILADEFKTEPAKVPQVWCLYKEVMDFYDAGMRVPDDVTLLWADDNWGNLRRLPTAAERMRSGGSGIYYHFDYHGGPRSYQWINANPLPKIWDQMSLAKQYGADRIWIVNVGHFKGYELATEYFMHLAWNTARWTNDNIGEFTRLWAAREFGPRYAPQIADILAKYAKYNGRRKPELLDAGTYSLVNYHEFERVVADFDGIAAKAQEISDNLPAADRAAFYELVLFPTQASAQLNRMYLAAARNALYASQGRASTDDMAAQTRALFRAETGLMDEYNRSFLNGRWDHFMDQPVIGYVNWRDPPQNNLDAIKLTDVRPPRAASMAVAVEGSEASSSRESLALPQFDAFNRQRRYIDIFNQGQSGFEFTAIAHRPWIAVDATHGRVTKDSRLWVSIDWHKVPRGKAAGDVTVSGAGRQVTVKVQAFNPTEPAPTFRGFVEGEGILSMEAEHFSANQAAGDRRWRRIEDYGRTLSGMRASDMRAAGPEDTAPATPDRDSPHLEYAMYLFDSGSFDVSLITAPTLNFIPGRGLEAAISLDDGRARMIEVVRPGLDAQDQNREWAQSVENNARTVHAKLDFTKPGYHTLKIWMIDPGVVLQKIVVDAGGLRPSYLGPPESFRWAERSAR